MKGFPALAVVDEHMEEGCSACQWGVLEGAAVTGQGLMMAVHGGVAVGGGLLDAVWPGGGRLRVGCCSWCWKVQSYRGGPGTVRRRSGLMVMAGVGAAGVGRGAWMMEVSEAAVRPWLQGRERGLSWRGLGHAGCRRWREGRGVRLELLGLGEISLD